MQDLQSGGKEVVACADLSHAVLYDRSVSFCKGKYGGLYPLGALRHVMSVFIRQRSVPGRHPPMARHRWLKAGLGAALLHILLLVALVTLPKHAPVDDDAAQEQTVAFVEVPRVSEAPLSTGPPPIPEPLPPSAKAEPKQVPPTPAVVRPPAGEPNSPDALPPPEPAAEPAPSPVRPPTPPEEAAVQPLPWAPSAAPVKAPPHRGPRPAIVLRPRVTAPESTPRASAQKATETASNPADVLNSYRNSLAVHLGPYRRYPALARARREEGLVVVHVTIQRDGEISALSVDQGSGSKLLDREALATLKRAEPLPPVPAGLGGATMDLEFPLRFHLE